MIIRKLFKFEGSHIVRNCSSRKCALSLHGHSYKVEVFLKSNKLDNGFMVYDFGLLKTYIQDIIDSFDHCITLWKNDDQNFINDMIKYSDRYVIVPFSPSAESFALMLHYLITQILSITEFKNNEDNVYCSSVRIHETDTGYAESEIQDLITYDLVNNKTFIDDFYFSPSIQSDWRCIFSWDLLKVAVKENKKVFINPLPVNDSIKRACITQPQTEN